MFEKNKKSIECGRGLESDTTTLPLNLPEDDCNNIENDNIIDTKRNNHYLKKAHTMLTKPHAVYHPFNYSVHTNGGFNEAKMDPNINDLNKQCKNLTLNELSKEKEVESSSNQKSSDSKEIYKEGDLKILTDLLNVLKKHKVQLDSLKKNGIDVESQDDSNEIVLRSRGHIKKNANKKRSIPFDKSNRDRSERIQLSVEPNINVGNKVHGYIQNDNFMDGSQEQDSPFPRFYQDQVILQALNNQQLMDQIIEVVQSELSEIEASEAQYNTDNIALQDTQPGVSFNDQSGTQQNIFIDPQTFSIDNTSSPPHQSFVSQNADSSSTLNSLSNTSKQNHLHFSSQYNNSNIGLVSLNHSDTSSPPQTFINCSLQHNNTSAESVVVLNPLSKSSSQQEFYNKFSLNKSMITQPTSFALETLTNIAPQQTFSNLSSRQNNIVNKPTALNSSQTSTSPSIYSLQNSPTSSQFFINYAQQHSETVIQSRTSPAAHQSPYTKISPNTSPSQIEVTDSSYETGSPSSSSAVTSPGSPYYRNSISSESDQELNAIEPRFVKSMNLINDQTARFIHKTAPSRPTLIKTEPILKPRGKAIQCSMKSAEQTLDELRKSALWKEHYAVQLVRVVISTKKNPNDCVEGFRENLMKTINTQMDKKHEKIWQLAIFVHLEFLKAPARVKEYKSALLRKNDKEQSLLYIAAVERKCPLIARYISEIMYRVGYNPGEADGKGNTILHLLACLGDSHAEVLVELLGAYDAQKKEKIFNVLVKNKEGKSLLHVAAASDQPQITTIVQLIYYGADPLLKDKFGQIALQYHLVAMAGGRMEGSRCQPLDVEVAKMLLPPSSIECRKVLERIISDPSTSKVVLNFIEDLKRERC